MAKQNKEPWGELLLNHILIENLKFTEGEEFNSHKGFKTDEGTQIPDVIINTQMAGTQSLTQKHLHVWDEYVNAEDEIDERKCIRST